MKEQRQTICDFFALRWSIFAGPVNYIQYDITIQCIHTVWLTGRPKVNKTSKALTLSMETEWVIYRQNMLFIDRTLQIHSHDIYTLTISGWVMWGYNCLARSRYALTAHRMLSVPPDVRLPTTLASPCSMLAVMATVSISKRLHKWMTKKNRLH